MYAQSQSESPATVGLCRYRLLDVEKQKLSVRAADILNLDRVAARTENESAITFTKLKTTVDFHTIAFDRSRVVSAGLDQVEVTFPASRDVGERMDDGRAGGENRSFEGDEALDGGGARTFPGLENIVLANGSDDGDQFVRLLRVGEVSSEVLWSQVGGVRLSPNLEEVDLLLVVAVVLAVPDTGASAGELDIATFQDLEIPHAILVLEFTADDVGEDFHLTMSVSSEALAGLDPILVNDAEGSERSEPRFPIVGE